MDAKQNLVITVINSGYSVPIKTLLSNRDSAKTIWELPECLITTEPPDKPSSSLPKFYTHPSAPEIHNVRILKTMAALILDCKNFRVFLLTTHCCLRGHLTCSGDMVPFMQPQCESKLFGNNMILLAENVPLIGKLAWCPRKEET